MRKSHFFLLLLPSGTMCSKTRSQRGPKKDLNQWCCLSISCACADLTLVSSMSLIQNRYLTAFYLRTVGCRRSINHIVCQGFQRAYFFPHYHMSANEAVNFKWKRVSSWRDLDLIDIMIVYSFLKK